MRPSLLVAALLLASCTLASTGPQRFEAVEPHMGTLFRIVLYAPDVNQAHQGFRAAFDRVAALDAELSDYNPQSELMRLCREAYRRPVQVSPDLFRVLAKSQEVARQSQGAFDITLGPVIQLWRTARRMKKLPDARELAAARPLVGYSKITLRPSDRTVQLASPGMQLDLGGIAKGYAADEALRVLRERGLPSALVAASGDLAIGEKPPNSPGWSVQIEPVGSRPAQILTLSHKAVSTSGDREQFVEIGGTRYSHIVDPRTGFGLQRSIGITVITGTGIEADSLATAACVITARAGVDSGFKFLKKHGAEALVMAEKNGDWQTRQSSAMLSPRQ